MGEGGKAVSLLLKEGGNEREMGECTFKLKRDFSRPDIVGWSFGGEGVRGRVVGESSE